MTMHITWLPQRSDATLEASVSGDILTINGESIDLSTIPEGATLPAFAVSFDLGEVSRIDGDLHVQMLLPYGIDPEPWQTHPDPMIVSDDGLIDAPCDTVVTVAEVPVAGGVEIVITTTRWRKSPEVVTTFVAIPSPEEPANDND